MGALIRGRILRYSLAVLIAAMVVALSGAVSGCTVQPGDSSRANKPIRIGAVLSLSGTYASLGSAEKDALELEVAEINKRGGIDGHPIELLIEDDATQESKSVSATNKFIEKDRVLAILGGSGTGISMAMRPLVEQANIAQISLAGGSVIIEPVSKNVFQTPWSTRLLQDTLFSYLAENNLKKVALVTDSGGYGKDGRAMALDLGKKHQLEFVVDTTFNPQDTDMTAQVQQIKNSSVDAVVVWNAGKETPLFLRQLKDAGVELPIFGGSGQARQEFLDGAQDSAENVTIITGKSFVPLSWGEGTEEYRVNTEFATRFSEKYGHTPDIFAGHAFDALHLIVDSLKRVDLDKAGLSGNASPSNTAVVVGRASLRDALEETRGVVGFGGVFEFSPTDHNGLNVDDIEFFHVKDGAWAIGPAEIVAGSQGQSSGTSLSNFLDILFSVLKNASLYALIALGFVVVFQATGGINFAHGEFVIFGGLAASGLVAAGIPYFLTLLIVVLFSLVFGWIFERILIQSMGRYDATRIVIVTVGASVLLQQIFLRIFGPDELSLRPVFEGPSIKIAGAALDVQVIVLLVVVLACYLGYLILYRHSKFGKAMRANQDSHEGALLCGVKASSVVSKSFMIASFVGAMAGILAAPLLQTVFNGGTVLGIKGFTVAILGGLANPLGSLGSAALLATLETLTGIYIHPLAKDVVTYVVLLIALIVRPTGIFSRKEKVKL